MRSIERTGTVPRALSALGSPSEANWSSRGVFGVLASLLATFALTFLTLALAAVLGLAIAPALMLLLLLPTTCGGISLPLTLHCTS